MNEQFEELVSEMAKQQRMAEPIVVHNKSDYENFRKVQEFINENQREFAQANRKVMAKERIAYWDRVTPPRWVGSSLTKTDFLSPYRESIMEHLRNFQREPSIYLYGPPGCGKTSGAYAIFRQMVGAGLVSPSQVVRVTEPQLAEMASSGFQGRDKLNALLDSHFEGLIIDDIGAIGAYDSKMQAVVDTVISHVYDSSIPTVLCSTAPPHKWVNTLAVSTGPKAETMCQQLVTMGPSATSLPADDGTFGDSAVGLPAGLDLSAFSD